mgnify:CR=1 FL=1
MNRRRVLISPLNWGFGHAGRMIPLALALRDRGHEVIFGTDLSMIPALSHELQGIRVIDIPGATMQYSRILPQYLAILLRLPQLIMSSAREHNDLKRLAENLHPDIIISDNRFGFFHKTIFSVYVTHMIRIAFPAPFRFLEPLGMWMHRKLIERYDLCLIPDYPGPVNLSGRLSHGMRLPCNAIYAGPFSRFSRPVTEWLSANLPDSYRCLILSGPEPQRSILKDKVTAVTSDMPLVILSGTGEHNVITTEENITTVSNPDTATMRYFITHSSVVISRSGYTTIMELNSLGKSAVIIPTPGQPEQEYLSEYLNRNGRFIGISQHEINKISHISSGDLKHSGGDYPDSVPLLENVLNILSDKEI